MARRSNPTQPSNPADESRQVALDRALGDITKRYGDGAIMRLGDAHHMVVEAIPTGALSLDIALGIGGIPRGRITEIYGPESSGKTTLCQHIVAEAQKMGGTCAYVDMEHALDPAMRRAAGSMLMVCSSLSPILENKHWRSPRRWSVRERLKWL